MATHVIADLHLRDAQDANAGRLTRYLAGAARDADALYVLGDLFDVWIGDDGSMPVHRTVLKAFAALADSGVPLYFMRGNRDFAVGRDFAAATRMQILEDPCVVDLQGTPTLLSHGDMLCSDDTEHQAFRARYTDARWRARMLRIPLPLRRLIARRARRKSTAGKAVKQAHIMDVNTDTVVATMRETGVRRLIHGHTHRPATHHFKIDSAPAERHVIADWRADQAEVMCVTPRRIDRLSLLEEPAVS